VALNDSPFAVQRQGVLLILAAAVLWGTTGTSQALAPVGASPLTIGTTRLLVGGAALLVVALARGGLGHWGRWPLLATVLAGACIALYQITFFAAVARTGVAVGTMVAIGSSPVIAGLLDWLVRRERPGNRWCQATLLAVMGCSLLVWTGGGISVNLVGILLALGAGASYAGYTLAMKQMLTGDRSPDAVVAVAFCLGAVLLLPLLRVAELGWITQPRGLLVMLHLGIIATALSYQLFVRGLQSVPVATAVTLSLAEPLTASLLGIIVVGERLVTLSLVGMLLIFGGLALLAIPDRPAVVNRILGAG
jgi:drug/metabolite transporter, DME family